MKPFKPTYWLPLFLILANGCTSSIVTSQLHDLAAKPKAFPQVSLPYNAVKPTKIADKPTELNKSLPSELTNSLSLSVDQAFTKEFKDIAGVSGDGDHPELVVTSVQMEVTPSFPSLTSGGSSIGILSFFIPFLSWVKTESDCPYTVNYELSNSRDIPLLNRNLSGSFQGYITGWYIARHAASAELLTKQAEFVGQDAARSVIADIYSHARSLITKNGDSKSQSDIYQTDHAVKPSGDSLSLDLSAQIPVVTLPKRTWQPETLAVVDLNTFTLSQGEVANLSNKLRTVLEQTDYFRVLSHTDMKPLFEEQKFQIATHCDKTQCLVEMGKLLKVEKIVGGSIRKVGSTFQLSIRLVNVETGEVLLTQDQTLKGDTDQLIRAMQYIGKALALQYSKTR